MQEQLAGAALGCLVPGDWLFVLMVPLEKCMRGVEHGERRKIKYFI